MVAEACASRLQSLQNVYSNQVAERIDLSIHQSQRFVHVAQLVKKVAFAAIVTGLAFTALFFVSPSLPILGVFVLVAGMAFVDSTNSSRTMASQNQGLSILITATASLSVKLGKLIYTPQIVAIALLANTILALPCICILSAAQLADAFFSRRVEELTNLKSEVAKMEADSTYHPSQNISEALLPMYKEIYIKPYIKGDLPTLPKKIKDQTNLLHHICVS